MDAPRVCGWLVALNAVLLGAMSLAVLGRRAPSGRFAASLRHAPWLVFTVFWCEFWTYHVDDAAISYAYARNLAKGFGLRPFLSAAPVEGFSNPLLVLLLAGAERVGVSAPSASKLIGLGCSLSALWLVRRVLDTRQPDQLMSDVAVAAIATSASFVVWSAGGLENPLLALALVGIIWAVSSGRSAALVGSFAAVAALCRPEGIAYAALVPLCDRILQGRSTWRRCVTMLLIPLFAIAAYQLFRIRYFNDVLPNTFYAKIGGSVGQRLLRGLVYVIGGLNFWLLLVPLAFEGARRSAALARLSSASAALALPGVAFAVYSGGDWMTQHRFLSHLTPLVALAVVPGSVRAAQDVGPGATRAWASFAALAFGVWQWRALASAVRQPTISMQYVTEQLALGRRLVRPECIATTPLSIATPDIGGMLWDTPSLRVIDIAGLIDRATARRMFRGTLHGAYWAERLRRERPVLIDVHGVWRSVLGLSDAELMGLGYRPSCRASGPPEEVASELALERAQPRTIYVRRDCERGDAQAQSAQSPSCSAELTAPLTLFHAPR